MYLGPVHPVMVEVTIRPPPPPLAWLVDLKPVEGDHPTDYLLF